MGSDYPGHERASVNQDSLYEQAAETHGSAIDRLARAYEFDPDARGDLLQGSRASAGVLPVSRVCICASGAQMALAGKAGSRRRLKPAPPYSATAFGVFSVLA